MNKIFAVEKFENGGWVLTANRFETPEVANDVVAYIIGRNAEDGEITPPLRVVEIDRAGYNALMDEVDYWQRQ